MEINQFTFKQVFSTYLLLDNLIKARTNTSKKQKLSDTMIKKLLYNEYERQCILENVEPKVDIETLFNWYAKIFIYCNTQKIEKIVYYHNITGISYVVLGEVFKFKRVELEYIADKITEYNYGELDIETNDLDFMFNYAKSYGSQLLDWNKKIGQVYKMLVE